MTTITIKDIARETGLSYQTVSKILNRSSAPFNKDTRQRVLQTAADLGYEPNRMARSLKTGKTFRICITTMLGDVGQYAAPYASLVYAGISSEFKNTGYEVTFNSTPVKQGDDQPNLVDRRQYDGAIFLLYSRNIDGIRKEQGAMFKNLPVPSVCISSVTDPIGVDNVTVDCREAGRLAAAHLIRHGYDSIGFVSTGEFKEHVEDLKKGYLKALADAGRPAEERYLFTGGSFNFRNGYDWAEEMIDRKVKLPRALVVFDEAFTFGVIRRFNESGIRVPQDIALVAFGNLRDEALGVTGLTCVSQPALEKGRQAARRMLALLQDEPGSAEPVTDAVPTELVVRSSCGCRNKHTMVHAVPRPDGEE